MKEVILTQNAPAAIGPYSQAIRVSASQMLFTSGQLGVDPQSGAFVSDDVAEQTKQALHNLAAILEASGFTKSHVVKTTIFLKDMNTFATVNEVYGAYFNENPPARSTVEVARLPKDAKVEIEAVAVR
jgi:2-iminobutanoate/2-iminopropanoate deaminase